MSSSSSSSSTRDNWERLVAAVLKREQFWQLCHQDSRSPSISTMSSHDFSGEILSFSSNNLEPISVYPTPQHPLTGPSAPQVSNHASSGPITRKLFSAWFRGWKSRDEDLVDIPEHLQIHLGQLRRFSRHELQAATDNFSNKNLLAHGYNEVYKGRLADGSLVAVKRPRNTGDFLRAQVRLKNEVEINNIAAHPNVITVLGFCITQKEWLLVYPLTVNGSVASWLRDREESQPPLSWPIRKGIALGAARGLAYLHEEICDMKIIHRDIKAANILLDEDFEAVVSDFELARIMDCDDTDVTTAVRGTIGHIAPEYLATGKCSPNTDVFGYGVFLLELITAQRAFDLARLANGDDVMLLDWVERNCKERTWESMVDADCGGNYMEDVVKQLVQIALLCTQNILEERPKMSDVVRMLEDGDGLAERWEERYKNEVEKENDSSKNYLYPDWIIDDDTFNLASVELSGPR